MHHKRQIKSLPFQVLLIGSRFKAISNVLYALCLFPDAESAWPSRPYPFDQFGLSWMAFSASLYWENYKEQNISFFNQELNKFYSTGTCQIDKPSWPPFKIFLFTSLKKIFVLEFRFFSTFFKTLNFRFWRRNRMQTNYINFKRWSGPFLKASN